MAPRGACSRLSAFDRTDVAGTRAGRHGVCPLSDMERLGQRDAEAGRAGVAAAKVVLPADAAQALKRLGMKIWFWQAFKALI